jgi:flagellar protein FlaF
MGQLGAYKTTIRNTETPRDIERRTLAKINSELQEELDALGPDGEIPAPIPLSLKEALWRNQQFWITIKADLMAPENALSDEIKATLISLAIFIDRKTSEVYTGINEVPTIIDLNNTIIRGLSGSQSTN